MDGRGYEGLTQRQLEFIWDKERMPEQERELVLGEIHKEIETATADPEPCDLYNDCADCPNVEDCFGLSPIPDEVRKEAA